MVAAFLCRVVFPVIVAVIVYFYQKGLFQASSAEVGRPPRFQRSSTDPQDFLFPENAKSMEEELEFMLRKHLLELWYPLAVDTEYGGFFTDFSYQWEDSGPQEDKMIVTQASHVYVASKAAALYPHDERYWNAAKHGFIFLRDTMWDSTYGGFHTLVSRNGRVIDDPRESRVWIQKTAYCNSFAIHGLVAFYRVSGNDTALKLAQDTFLWLEKHSYDPQYGGYFQFMNRDGVPLRDGTEYSAPKDQNSALHLMESFTELYRVWPDPLLRDRLYELLMLARDTITTDIGYMIWSFSRQWKPLPYGEAQKNSHYDLQSHALSIGHNLQAAVFLTRASEALHLDDGGRANATCKRLVDYALRYGWDEVYGGFFDKGTFTQSEPSRTVITSMQKKWSVQAEALDSLLMMADLIPNDDMEYEEKIHATFRYIKRYFVDSEHGGWYACGIDREPRCRTDPKGTIWQANYHSADPVMRSLERLRSNQGILATCDPHNVN